MDGTCDEDDMAIASLSHCTACSNSLRFIRLKFRTNDTTSELLEGAPPLLALGSVISCPRNGSQDTVIGGDAVHTDSIDVVERTDAGLCGSCMVEWNGV